MMIGRAAYHTPADILARVDPVIFGTGAATDPVDAARAMLPYIDKHLSQGGKIGHITRHMPARKVSVPNFWKKRSRISCRITICATPGDVNSKSRRGDI